MRQLGALKPPETVALLLDMVRKDAADAVRVEAARALAGFDDPKIPDRSPRGVEGVTRRSSRPDVVNTLATRKEWAKRLLTAMAEKKIDRAEVTDNTILRIQAFKDKELNALIEKAWGRTRPTPAELNELIDKTRASLHEAPGVVRARPDGVREQLRASATSSTARARKSARRSKARPATSSTSSSTCSTRTASSAHRTSSAPHDCSTTPSSRACSPRRTTRPSRSRSKTAVLKKIKKEDLNGPIQVSEKSLMPEGLGYNMTAQDFRDLVRYLMANPFLTDVTVNGEKQPLSVGVPGRIAAAGHEG